MPEASPGVRCPTGEARTTPGFRLPARWVVHTVGPVWQGGGAGEAEALAQAYTNSVREALEHGAESVAFPAISTGVYGYPPEKAARVAIEAIQAFQAERGGPQRVVLVAYSAEASRVLREALS